MIRKSLFAAVALLGLSSCSLINDDSDCTQSVNTLQFHYDRNMKFSCASAAEVKSVTVMAFDASTGLLVSADRLVRDHAEGEPETELRIAPGEYDVLVWAGNYDDHFDIASARPGESKLSDFTASLTKSDARLEPLFHSLRRLKLGYNADSAPVAHDFSLTKNTNTVRILLQHLSGEEIAADDFTFEITDNNSLLDFNNLRHVNSGTVAYKPFEIYSGTSDINSGAAGGSKAQASLSVAMAEFDVNRLFADSQGRLVVRRAEDGETVVSIPLVQALLLYKGLANRDMDDQEFLDRQDEYNLTFFLDSRNRWVASSIIINDWRVVLKQSSLS